MRREGRHSVADPSELCLREKVLSGVEGDERKQGTDSVGVGFEQGLAAGGLPILCVFSAFGGLRALSGKRSQNGAGSRIRREVSWSRNYCTKGELEVDLDIIDVAPIMELWKF